ncbi:unnamed protein product [Somion occarium]|uniref:Uncharacterized protein n=1 Tax=Somion occarium TaxID=3059160 RepID=A0ABP1D861_9APHY
MSFSTHRSPNQRNRTGRNPRLQRSTSVLGRLKSLIFNPFGGWTGSDVENEQGKRLRNQDIGFVSDHERDAERRAKRKRFHSPELEDDQLHEQRARPTTNGFLDPSHEMFDRPSANKGVARASSLAIPPSVPKHPQERHGRYSLSPQPTASLRAVKPHIEPEHAEGTVDAARVPLPLSRDASMNGISGAPTRDSKSPSRAHFRMRTSLTPQPSGQSFGPSRRERERSEPPPLASLASNPVFVKAPQLPTVTEEPARSSTVPLGALPRKSVQPGRQRSVLALGRQPSDIDMAPPERPMSAAEKALRQLDMYKTPLLPSRMRGSPTIPDAFKPKPVHPMSLMHDDRDDKPRLGTSEKQSAKRRSARGKPYSGSSSAKKLLERRRQEEQEQKAKEREEAIVTDAEEEEAMKTAKAKPSEELREERVLQRRGFTVAAGGRERSSLRVGRTKTNRAAERPVSAKPKRGFSAVYDEEELEETLLEEEETPKLPPMFQPPPDFSFANVSSPVQVTCQYTKSQLQAAPINHDATKAKEPPIAALPFALSKPQAPVITAPTPPVSAKPPSPPAEAPVKEPSVPVTTAAAAAPVSAPAPSTPLFAAVPSVALVPPSPPPAPTPAKPTETQVGIPVSGTGTSIPNFFANSALLHKAPAPISAPFTLLTGPTEVTTPQTSLFGKQPAGLAAAAPIQEKVEPAMKEKVTLPSMFGAAPTTFGPPAPPAAAAPTPTTTRAEPTPAVPFSFGAPKPAEAAAPAVPSTFSFGAPPKAPEPTTKPALPFSFGAPAKPAEPPSAPSPLPFTFGAPKADVTVKEPEAKPAAGPSPMFGTAPVTSAFGAPAASAPAAPATTEPPKPTFAFGQPEAPKPLFGTGAPAFSFGQPSAPAAAPSKAPFTFGPPTAATTETKPAFVFGGTPSPAPPSAGVFGAPTAATTGAAAATKPFTFGPTTPARPVTPPQKDNEMSMDESPTRGNAMELNGNEQLKAPSAFSFAPSPTSPFGQPPPSAAGPAPFMFGGTPAHPFGAKPAEQKQAEKPATAFGSFGQAAASPFSFGPKPSESARPATSSGAFSFTQPPPINTSPFAFAAPSTSTSAFGAPSPTSAFGFGTTTPTSTTAPSHPFTFGSQPASPATAHAGLPQTPAGGSAFTFGGPPSATTTAAPASPFGAPPALPSAPTTPLFTVGSAPPATPTAPGPTGRILKKLPSRRGGKR